MSQFVPTARNNNFTCCMHTRKILTIFPQSPLVNPPSTLLFSAKRLFIFLLAWANIHEFLIMCAKLASIKHIDDRVYSFERLCSSSPDTSCAGERWNANPICEFNIVYLTQYPAQLIQSSIITDGSGRYSAQNLRSSPPRNARLLPCR